MALITVPTPPNKHTSNMCESSNGCTTITTNPDEEKSTEGVSLKYILSSEKNDDEVANTSQFVAVFGNDELKQKTPTIDEVLSPDYQQPEGYNWYFLRVNYGRAEQFYKAHKDNKEGYLLWMPCQKNIKYVDGMKIESLDPIFKSNLFIYSTYDQAFSLTHRAPETGYSYVDFAYDHTKRNEFGRDHVITIRFRDMLQFIKAEHIHHPWAHVVPPEKIHFREGGMVRVTGGSFEGVEGYVARVFGQTRVIVTIKGIVNYATAYVSQKYLQPIEESECKDAEQKTEAGHSIRNRIPRHELKNGGYIPPEDKLKKGLRKREH